MNQYRLQVFNRSTMFGSVLLFLRYPQQEKTNDAVSVVWMKKDLHPGTDAEFLWDSQVCFTWCETKKPNGSASVQAFQTMEADLTDEKKRAVKLELRNHAYLFTALPQAEDAVLRIELGNKVHEQSVWAGLGVSGLPAILYVSRPGATIFLPDQLEYWICFESPGSVRQGDMIPQGARPGTYCVGDPEQVIFPPNGTELRAVLKENNLWEWEPL